MEPRNLIIADEAAKKGTADFITWYRDALLPEGGAVVASKEEVEKAACYAERIIMEMMGSPGFRLYYVRLQRMPNI